MPTAKPFARRAGWSDEWARSLGSRAAVHPGGRPAPRRRVKGQQFPAPRLSPLIGRRVLCRPRGPTITRFLAQPMASQTGRWAATVRMDAAASRVRATSRPALPRFLRRAQSSARRQNSLGCGQTRWALQLTGCDRHSIRGPFVPLGLRASPFRLSPPELFVLVTPDHKRRIVNARQVGMAGFVFEQTTVRNEMRAQRASWIARQL